MLTRYFFILFALFSMKLVIADATAQKYQASHLPANWAHFTNVTDGDTGGRVYVKVSNRYKYNESIDGIVVLQENKHDSTLSVIFEYTTDQLRAEMQPVKLSNGTVVIALQFMDFNEKGGRIRSQFLKEYSIAGSNDYSFRDFNVSLDNGQVQAQVQSDSGKVSTFDGLLVQPRTNWLGVQVGIKEIVLQQGGTKLSSDFSFKL